MAFSFLVIIFIGYLWLKLTFLSPENKVKNIIFNPENINYFDEPSLYSKISSWLQNKNIYSLKADSKGILNSIQKDFPIVENINFQNSWENTYINLKFFKPTLIFNHQGSYVWVYNWYFFPITNDSLFLSWRAGIILPRYVDILTWSAFHEVPEQTLKYQMERIVTSIWPKKIIYLLGGNKTIAQTQDDKYIIFDNFARSADINVQLEKYWLFLANNSIPSKDIKVIDLGSMDDSVIVSTWNYFGTGLDFWDFDIKPTTDETNVDNNILSWENLSWENLSWDSSSLDSLTSDDETSSSSWKKSSSSKMSTTDRA